MSTSIDRSTLARDLVTQLHEAFLTHGRPPGLEPALCAYVDYWRSRGVDRARITDVTRAFVDRVSGDHPTTAAEESAAYEAMTAEMLGHCLSLVHE